MTNIKMKIVIYVFLCFTLVGCTTKQYPWVKTLDTQLHCGMSTDDVEEKLREISGSSYVLSRNGKLPKQFEYNHSFYIGSKQALRLMFNEQGLYSSYVSRYKKGSLHSKSEIIYYCSNKEQ